MRRTEWKGQTKRAFLPYLSPRSNRDLESRGPLPEAHGEPTVATATLAGTRDAKPVDSVVAGFSDGVRSDQELYSSDEGIWV